MSNTLNIYLKTSSVNVFVKYSLQEILLLGRLGLWENCKNNFIFESILSKMMKEFVIFNN